MSIDKSQIVDVKLVGGVYREVKGTPKIKKTESPTLDKIVKELINSIYGNNPKQKYQNNYRGLENEN